MLKLLKTATSIVIGIGSETIISGIVKNVIQDNTNVVTNACAKIASIVIAGVVTQACTDHVDKAVDEAAAVFKGAVDAAKKKAEPAQEGA